jgi:hypothetical protein
VTEKGPRFDRGAVIRTLAAVLSLPYVPLQSQLQMLLVCKSWTKNLRLAPERYYSPLALADEVWFDNLRRCVLDCENLSIPSQQLEQVSLALGRDATRLSSLALFNVDFEVCLPPRLASRLRTLELHCSVLPELECFLRLTHLHLLLRGLRGLPSCSSSLDFSGCPRLEVLQTNLRLQPEHVASLPLTLQRLVLDVVSEKAIATLPVPSLSSLCVRGVLPDQFAHEFEFEFDFDFERDDPSFFSADCFGEVEEDLAVRTKGRTRTKTKTAVTELVLDSSSEEHDALVLSYLELSALKSLQAFHKRLAVRELACMPALTMLTLHGVPLELRTLSVVSQMPVLDSLVLEHNYTHTSEEPNWLDLSGSQVRFLVVCQVWMSCSTETVLIGACRNLMRYTISQRGLDDCCRRKLVSYL